MSQDDPLDKEPVAPDSVWEQLDGGTRARVIEMFAHLCYQNAAARHEESIKEGEDVSPRSDAKDQAGTH